MGGGGLLRRQGWPGQFADHAVGTGPFRLAVYEKQYRFVLERNEPGTARCPPTPPRPAPCSRRRSTPRTSPQAASTPRMPAVACHSSIASISTREREDIPRFNKLLQGYYDDGGIIKESFDAVVQDDRLSPDMQARGMRLDKTVEPSVFYIGFNMDDPSSARRQASAPASCARP